MVTCTVYNVFRYIIVIKPNSHKGFTRDLRRTQPYRAPSNPCYRSERARSAGVLPGQGPAGRDGTVGSGELPGGVCGGQVGAAAECAAAVAECDCGEWGSEILV